MHAKCRNDKERSTYNQQATGLTQGLTTKLESVSKCPTLVSVCQRMLDEVVGNRFMLFGIRDGKIAWTTQYEVI